MRSYSGHRISMFLNSRSLESTDGRFQTESVSLNNSVIQYINEHAILLHMIWSLIQRVLYYNVGQLLGEACRYFYHLIQWNVLQGYQSKLFLNAMFKSTILTSDMNENLMFQNHLLFRNYLK